MIFMTICLESKLRSNEASAYAGTAARSIVRLRDDPAARRRSTMQAYLLSLHGTFMQRITELFSLHGQVAIVTGAGKGIGRACAIALAQAGADVALMARTQRDLDATADEIHALGRRTLMVAGDVNDDAVQAAVVQGALAELGKVTILVNNAGGAGPTTRDACRRRPLPTCCAGMLRPPTA
jgi:hypothetical protein